MDPLPGVSQPPPEGMIAPAPRAGPDQTLAIASIAFAVASWLTGFQVAAAIPAVVLGWIARRRAREDPGAYGGEALAMGGMVAGLVNVVMHAALILLVLALVLVPVIAAAIALLVEQTG
jgi:hypothetical protein